MELTFKLENCVVLLPTNKTERELCEIVAATHNLKTVLLNQWDGANIPIFWGSDEAYANSVLLAWHQRKLPYVELNYGALDVHGASVRASYSRNWPHYHASVTVPGEALIAGNKLVRNINYQPYDRGSKMLICLPTEAFAAFYAVDVAAWAKIAITTAAKMGLSACSRFRDAPPETLESDLGDVFVINTFNSAMAIREGLLKGIHAIGQKNVHAVADFNHLTSHMCDKERLWTAHQKGGLQHFLSFLGCCETNIAGLSKPEFLHNAIKLQLKALAAKNAETKAAAKVCGSGGCNEPCYFRPQEKAP